MDLISIVFYLFAVVIVISASVVVFSKNIMYSAFSLLFTFFGVAGIYVLLNADFLAITQIMIYVGGILVLIIFAVMLTSKISGVDVKTSALSKVQKGLAGLICAIVAVALIIIYNSTTWFVRDVARTDMTINQIGNELLTNYLLAFEAASMLLLIAIIGAALIARRKH
jgi:NADH-quinone oxidoreductase subunit J